MATSRTKYTKTGQLKAERSKIKMYKQEIKDAKFMIKLHRDSIRSINKNIPAKKRRK